VKSLVVDDEIVSRKKLQKILSSFGRCDDADSGGVAIETFREGLQKGEPYDLVMLDISMPEMNGTDVLFSMRRAEKEAGISRDKRVKVVMVTSHTDKDTVITCIQAGCDEYIKKPFERETIAGKLRRLGLDVSPGTQEKQVQGSIRENVLRVIDRFKKGQINLPVMPRVVEELEKVIGHPNTSVDDVRRIVEEDAVVSLRLISIANSPIYRGREKVQSLTKAISRVGFKETQTIVMAVATNSLYETKNTQFRDLMEKLRIYSLTCAHCARAIARKLGFMDAERFFLMGLIHDIGNVLLLRTLGEVVPPDQSFDVMSDIVPNIQAVHTTFGAALLQRWKLTEDYIDVAKLHEGPQFDSTTSKEVLVVNLACNLVRGMGLGFFEHNEIDLSELESARILGMNPVMLREIAEEVKESINTTADT
jgi:HD-like signal output (HDOD) protein